MINLLLSILSRLLFLAISPVSLVYVVFVREKFTWYRLFGYWRNDAVGLDRYGNYNYRSLFNAVLVKKYGYQFGDFRETISSVLGKNEKSETLTKSGKILVKILNAIDKNHCEKSIIEL